MQRHINYRSVTERFYALKTKKRHCIKVETIRDVHGYVVDGSTVIQSLIWFITAHTAKDLAAAAARTSQ